MFNLQIIIEKNKEINKTQRLFDKQTKFERSERRNKMGNFSTGLILGALLGVGLAMMDKKDVKKAKKMMRGMHM